MDNLETPQRLSAAPSSSVQFPVESTNSDPDGVPLLPDGQPSTPRSHIVSSSFVSSPLNPNAVAYSSGSPSLLVGSRAQSRPIFNCIVSEESLALTSQQSSFTSNRASMILYRLAGEEEQHVLIPAALSRQSVLSSSRDSVFTVSYDSKYPSYIQTPSKLVPFPFDPNLHIDTSEDDDALHDPSDHTWLNASSGITIRGFVNVGVLVLVILSLLCLFIFYPVWRYTVNQKSQVS